MPKCQSILPDQVRTRSHLELSPIPVNAYDGSVRSELEAGRYTALQLRRIHRDMALIRAFESALDSVKRKGQFGGVEYTHRGPAHLSIGQEAAAVGQALELTLPDHIYGSHRSHGEILAKGLSAVAQLDDDQLLHVMSSYFDGQALRVVERGSNYGSVTELAVDYLVYGALAEIFWPRAGVQQGTRRLDARVLCAIRDLSQQRYCRRLGRHCRRRGALQARQSSARIVVANIGDASAGCGPTWEALCFATMDQFRLLWDEPRGHGLPFIMNFVNNFYGMGGQPVGETMGFGVLARVG
jgi:2-oxoisovalerate dehydrogenase E1 component